MERLKNHQTSQQLFIKTQINTKKKTSKKKSANID